ncbi:cell wall metabolism sensor histidine kinase WalK [Symplocastrum sp. BBK-W-15]|uniref:histidine kinase n=1 Tax=Limnofasciculus baicalensis BBK-W-15 TaxID=2699891 RepID=A0AAE3KL60_9CYAN|nr:cell wall metabolism sensor histidine kinase WalK [Limnofasciculus baicalensis BBK-W-15]
MMGSLDLLGSGQLGTLTNRGQNVLNIAITNTERLIRLVNDILDLERMKSGKIAMEIVKCNGADLLKQAAEAMESMAEKSQVKLIVNPVNVELWADPDRIVQTLTNLLGNGIKFSEAGSTIWISGELVSGEWGLESGKSIKTPYILFSVKDRGRGIPSDKIQIIFDRFQQVDASDSRQKGGTGLGLAICRNIVEQHHGKIWVESVVGEGSTFYVLLPLVPCQKPHA